MQDQVRDQGQDKEKDQGQGYEREFFYLNDLFLILLENFNYRLFSEVMADKV